MSGLAAIIYWDAAAVDKHAVERMLASIPHRAPDGSNAATGGNCSMGFARFSTTLRERTAVQPLHDEEHGIWLVGDVRLDNRDELSESLRGSGEPVPPDPELLVLGYRRWGNDMAGHLVGDFAFVLWDERDRTLYAARDPFGVRPLYYHANATRLVFATEVAQILALRDFEWKVEDRMVVAYLASNYQHDRDTFFQDIFRVVPGHYVVCRDRALREERYWFPPREELRLGRPEDYQEEFKRLFQQSVADRLESDGGPIIAHLSGGLDSTSIVCMADAIYGQEPAMRPPLYTASAVFPGLACDETQFIDAVARKVRFPSERWDGTGSDWEELRRPYVADPTRDPQAGILFGVDRLAAREGVRVVLSGEGGDQLLTEVGVFRDLAANHRWLRLLQEARAINKAVKRGWLKWVRDGVIYTSPRVFVRAYASLRARRHGPPKWLAGGLREGWPRLPWAPRVFSEDSWLSHTQQCTWNLLASPFGYWNREWQELGAARSELSHRFPFFDSRLVRFVLAVPFEQRLPGGKWKLLLRQAMTGLLPDEVANRQDVTVFSSNVRLQLRSHLDLLKPVVCDGPEWFSEPYVNRCEAQKLLRELAEEKAEETDMTRLFAAWNIAMLELWLRELRHP
jgi:asparagine synthase (glutamine-hydrolysing)